MFLYFKTGNKGGKYIPETTTNGQKAPPSQVWCEQAMPRETEKKKKEHTGEAEVTDLKREIDVIEVDGR